MAIWARVWPRAQAWSFELADFVDGFFVEAIFERVTRTSGAGVCGDAVQVFIREHAAVEDGEGDAADAFLLQDVEEAIVFGLSGQQIVFGLMDQAGRTQVAQDLRCLSGFVGRIIGDANIEGATGSDGEIEGTHGFCKRRVGIGAMVVEDIDIIYSQAFEALIEAGNEVFSRAKIAIGSGPHIKSCLGGDNQFVPVGR